MKKINTILAALGALLMLSVTSANSVEFKAGVSANGMAAYANAQEAVKDNTWLKKEISHINKWKDIFFKTFKSLNITTNKSYANFMLININNLKDNSRNIFLKLAKSGILLREMDVYKIKNCLRVTIGKVKENKKFLSTLKKIINV